MLLPKTKEREYRFKLALRIGLPIFALFITFISYSLITNYQNLQVSFYVEALMLMALSVYFILYLIYNGFSVKITDDVTKTFTREYLYNYLEKEIKEKKNYTLILISIDNLNDINNLYGIKNGDKVLREVSLWVANYFKNENIENFPLGHIKGGEFIIGLNGLKAKYSTILELMCLKSSDFKVDNIEVKISGAITDTLYSSELDYLIENLFEILETTKNKENLEDISPNELESIVINAINKKNLIIMSQDIYKEDKVVMKECFVKLIGNKNKIIYPKTYLKVINKLGLGINFDLVVLETILENCSKENSKTFAINILPTSLRNDKFLSRVKELLKDSKTKIMFVLFEMEYYSHIDKYKYIINSLKEFGVMFAIDRVGSIHTSFLYLRELDIDVIRFDTYYSREDKLKKNRSIIEGFNLIAEQKNIKSWIKNVEDAATLTIAKEINIDYIQGKYLSELLPSSSKLVHTSD